MKTDHHPLVQKLLDSEKNDQLFLHFLITRPIPNNSYKDCIFWTIENIKDKLTHLPEDDLSKRTAHELINLNPTFQIDKAIIFDELSAKNWKLKSKLQNGILFNNVFSRLSWVCLLAICKENNKAYQSNYAHNNSIPPKAFYNLVNLIGTQCGVAIDMAFKNESNYQKGMAKSLANLMEKIENKNL